jgi:hypothetical protein
MNITNPPIPDRDGFACDLRHTNADDDNRRSAAAARFDIRDRYERMMSRRIYRKHDTQSAEIICELVVALGPSVRLCLGKPGSFGPWLAEIVITDRASEPAPCRGDRLTPRIEHDTAWTSPRKRFLDSQGVRR